MSSQFPEAADACLVEDRLEVLLDRETTDSSAPAASRGRLGLAKATPRLCLNGYFEHLVGRVSRALVNLLNRFRVRRLTQAEHPS